MASAQSTFVSREDFKAQKALEDARKAGTAPYQLDEDGKEINPHMPQYIIQAPWYLNQNQPSLKHQKLQANDQKAGIGQWYARGARQGEIATKFRKGACENCGSMTHKTKECCERPRKIGAKFTGKDIQPDEIVQELQLDYDAKRDRWNGYDPDMYEDVVKEYELHDQIRKKAKREMLSSMDGVGVDGEAGKDGADQEDADFKDDEGEEHDAPVASRDPRTKTTTRQLRIREDTAKYLLNLEEKSAYYDGKSRSMRENPNPHLPADKQMFRGDNSARYTGDTLKMLDQERAVWENIDRNVNPDLNTVAVPTGTEMVHKAMKEKITKEAQEKVQNLIDKYGGETNTNPDTALIFGQTEKYVEFTLDGKVKRTNELVRGNKSRYEEDVFINDHMTVWGSWWNKELGWGYACCHSNTRDSRCIGEKGKKNAIIREYKKVKEREEALKRAEEEAKQKGLIEDVPEEPKETFKEPMQKAVAQSAPATKPKEVEEEIPSKKEQAAPKHEAKKPSKEDDDEKDEDSSSSSDDDDDESSSQSKSGSDSNSSDD